MDNIKLLSEIIPDDVYASVLETGVSGVGSPDVDEGVDVEKVTLFNRFIDLISGIF